MNKPCRLYVALINIALTSNVSEIRLKYGISYVFVTMDDPSLSCRSRTFEFCRIHNCVTAVCLFHLFTCYLDCS